MAAAAQIVEGMGADIVDVNMGCPVPKIAKHNAGCSLMREPAHAADVVARDGQGGEDSGDGEDARGLGRSTRSTRRSWRGGWRTPARRRSRCTAGPRRNRIPGVSDWDADRARGAGVVAFRCSAAATASSRRTRRAAARAACRGVLVGRGALRNPWIFQQAADVAARRAPREVTPRIAGGSCSTTSSCCCTSGSARPKASATSRPASPRPAPSRAGARPRSLGDQQAARAEFLVHQGARQRVAPAHRDQRGGVDPPPARDHRGVLRRPSRSRLAVPMKLRTSSHPQARSRRPANATADVHEVTAERRM